MEYRPLGQTALSVSSIGLGCVTFGREIEPDAAFTVMDRARERGITLFDTAEAYAAGRSEEVVGQWLADRGRRDEIVLATKVAGAQTREHITASAEDSLRRLQTDHIDLFKVHNWDGETPLEETIGALDTLVREGKVRHVGCSNYDADQLAQALAMAAKMDAAPMQATQPNYNLVVREIEAELLPLCIEHKVSAVTYSPLGAGFLTGKYRREGPLPEGTRFDIMPAHQDIYFKDEYFDVIEGLRAKADETGRTMIDLALAWVIGQPGVTSVLVGARGIEQVDQAFAAEETGLTDELRAALSAL